MSGNKGPLLQRLGLAYFRSRGEPSRLDDAVHILDEEEHRALRRIERGVIARAALAGGLSAFASAVAELYAEDLFGEAAGPAASMLWYWALIGGVTAVATGFELAFLYWDALRSVRALADAAGLALFEGDPSVPSDVAVALSRAALELPNPRQSVRDIDAHREANKLALVTWALAYKLKIGVTNFLVKALLRRAAGRVALRAYFVFVAVPITALWNALVAWVVIREARIRVMGPSAAHAFLDDLDEELKTAAPEVRAVCVRAVAAAIVRTQDLHPNLEVLLEGLLDDLDEAPGELDRADRFIDALLELDEADRGLVLQVFAYALVLDGRLHRREIELWKELMAKVGRAVDVEALKQLTREFRAGDPLDAALLERAVG